MHFYYVETQILSKETSSHLSSLSCIPPLRSLQKLLVQTLSLPRCHALNKILDLIFAYDKLAGKLFEHNLFSLPLTQFSDLGPTLRVHKDMRHRVLN